MGQASTPAHDPAARLPPDAIRRATRNDGPAEPHPCCAATPLTGEARDERFRGGDESLDKTQEPIKAILQVYPDSRVADARLNFPSSYADEGAC